MSKILKIKTHKKVLATILLILTIFSVVQPVVFAASGTGKWTGGQFASGIKTTDNPDSSTGMLIRKLINITTKEKKTVFCVEHGIDFKTSATYNGSYYTPTDAKVKLACKIAYFGWYSKYGDYVIDGGILANDMIWVKMDYVFTQQYIWEVLGQSNATFIDSDIQNQYQAFKDTINTQIDSMQTQPSFVGDTIEIETGETITIEDNSGVLSQYSGLDKTVDGIRIVHNEGENKLTITVDDNCNIEKYKISDATFAYLGMVKEETKDNDTTIYFSFPEGVQDQLYALHYNDPVTLSLNLKISQLGKLELSKLNTNGDLVDGSVFTVSGPGYNGDVSVTNGKITLDKLKKGVYSIKEKSAKTGYLLNTETYKVEVKSNETATQAIVNSEPTGSITIIKKDSETGSKAQGDATFLDAKYEVYAMEDIYNAERTKKYYSANDLVATRTMSENGTTQDITDLPLGKFLVKERLSSLGYLIDTNEYEVNLEYKDQKTKVVSKIVTSYEVVKKMQVHIFKSGIKINSGVTPGLEGAEFTIKLNSDVEKAYSKGYSYAEVWNGLDEYGNKVKVDKNRVAEAQKIAPTYETIKTDKDGNAYTEEKMPYGKFICKETYTPKDFETASDFYFSITQDESEVKEISQKIKHIVVNNEQLETYIKLVKQDLKTGKTVTLNSATFEIKATKDIYDRATGEILYKKGESVKQKVGSTTYTTFTTNAKNIVIPTNSYNTKFDELGSITTPLTLPVGSYEILELQVPERIFTT